MTLRIKLSEQKVNRKAIAVSNRFTRSSTTNPKSPMEKTSKPLLPHCPGEIHALCVSRMVTIIPKLVGLKKCLAPFDLPKGKNGKRKMNLLEIVRTDASTITNGEFVFSIRHKLSAEIAALFSER